MKPLTTLLILAALTGCKKDDDQPAPSTPPTVYPVSEQPILVTPANFSTSVALPTTYSWRRVPHATSYHLSVLRQGTGGMANYLTSAYNPIQVTDTFFVQTNAAPAQPGSTIVWKVRGSGSGGPGPWSQEWTFTTP